jgi:hypothetical protein
MGYGSLQWTCTDFREVEDRIGLSRLSDLASDLKNFDVGTPLVTKLSP